MEFAIDPSSIIIIKFWEFIYAEPEHSLEREVGNVENRNSFPNCGDLDDIVLYTVFVDVKSAELQPTTR